jgi:hypothetical protein
LLPLIPSLFWGEGETASEFGDFIWMCASVHRSALKRAHVAPVTQPAGADQAAVTLGNGDGEIAGFAISDPPTQAEVQALRDKCEELADDLRALSVLVHALRTALVAVGLIKGTI